METTDKDAGWNEWSKHVLYQLEKSNLDRDKMKEEIRKLQEETLTMKVQAGMIATGASLVIGFVNWLINIKS